MRYRSSVGRKRLCIPHRTLWRYTNVVLLFIIIIKKLIYFGVKRSTGHKNIAGVGLCTPVSAGRFYSFITF